MCQSACFCFVLSFLSHAFLKAGLPVTSCLATGGKYYVGHDEEIKSGRGNTFPKADIFDKLLLTDGITNLLTKYLMDELINQTTDYTHSVTHQRTTCPEQLNKRLTH
jgi:hypothetical protein